MRQRTWSPRSKDFAGISDEMECFVDAIEGVDDGELSVFVFGSELEFLAVVSGVDRSSLMVSIAEHPKPGS